MYKHEILNDFSRMSDAYREKYSIDIIEEFVDMATEIYIGNMDEFINMEMFVKTRKDIISEAITGHNPFSGLMTPFQITLFSGFLSKMRTAVLVLNNYGLYLEAITLVIGNKNKEWAESGVVRFMIVGDEMESRSKLRRDRGISDESGFMYKSVDAFGTYLKHAHPSLLENTEKLTGYIMNSVILSLHFLSCKNVKLTTTAPKISAAQRITSKAKNKLLPFEYRTITIDGIGKQKGGTLGIGTTEQRLHICRGHFAEYTEERRLFGKYVGRYWIPAHVRGNPELGTIEKDYEVKHEALTNVT